jgi:glycosyltransferase involved in cell wall biosynthesis/GT2 family glycosyltransferase
LNPPPVKVLFASCAAELVPDAVKAMRAILPATPLVVVSEFPPPDGEWIQYHIHRSIRENIALCRARLAGRRIRLGAVILQPNKPYGRLRWMALRMAPFHLLVFNEYLNHFALRPRDLPAILRHYRWRLREFIEFQTHAGGWLYTWIWRFAHPQALRRPLFYRTALAGGAAVALLRRTTPVRPGPSLPDPLPEGISVVIPSRNGRELLSECLPAIHGVNEIIVVDNGSDDGTAAYMQTNFPEAIVELSAAPLSFASAVNRGIARARFSHVCLLNNDMIVEPGFFEALRAAFGRVPDLFCATAQIFMPPGQRREETGKAVMPMFRARTAFPITCDLPVEGEEHSYVLYGSGGASLYDTRKLRALGGISEAYVPAYVEDLDAGFNGWRLGWPTVFVAGARVLHRHRSTTSRYYTGAQLSLVLERNYLRFLVRSVTDPALFRPLWVEAIWRINVACIDRPENVEVLREAGKAPGWIEQQPAAAMPEAEILAVGSGAIAVFPGSAPKGRPVVMVVSPYLPFPLSHGGAVRMYNLMRRAAADFEQVLVCFTGELQPVAPELLDLCVEVVYVKRYHTHAFPSTERPDTVEEFDSPAFRAALHQTVRKWKPRIAQLEFTQMAQYGPDCAPARTLLVEHDVTLDLYAQLLAQHEDWETRRQYEQWVRFEQQMWGRVDRVVTMSDKDRRAVGRAHAVTLPNGVDIDHFQPSAGAPEPRRILFIGSFAHLPNVLAIDFFLREAWPRLKPLAPTLHIIAGSRPEFFLERYRQRVRPDLDQPGIELESFVSDVREAYRRATVVIAPLLASAGTNIKVMEAMAMGKAIVSTPAGINGLDDLEHGRDVIVTNSGSEMAEVIARLLDEPDRRREIERQARKTAVERYDWDVIARQQADLYRGLL